MFVPAGFAHGFQAVSEVAEIAYHIDRPDDPQDDPAISTPTGWSAISTTWPRWPTGVDSTTPTPFDRPWLPMAERFRPRASTVRWTTTLQWSAVQFSARGPSAHRGLARCLQRAKTPQPARLDYPIEFVEPLHSEKVAVIQGLGVPRSQDTVCVADL